jgi:hypothetical protein
VAVQLVEIMKVVAVEEQVVIEKLKILQHHTQLVL